MLGVRQPSQRSPNGGIHEKERHSCLRGRQTYFLELAKGTDQLAEVKVSATVDGSPAQPY